MGKLPALRQLAVSILPYSILWGLMVRTLGIPSWISVALIVPAVGVLGSIFLALTGPPNS